MHDITDEEILKLQKNIDEWYATWVSSICREEINNYIHILVPGHMVYYLKNYCNVYRFSHQVWERQNKRGKRIYL